MVQRMVAVMVILGVLVACSGAAADGDRADEPSVTSAAENPADAAESTDPVFGGASFRVTGSGNAVVPMPPGNDRFVLHATFTGPGRFFVSGQGRVARQGRRW